MLATITGTTSSLFLLREVGVHLVCIRGPSFAQLLPFPPLYLPLELPTSEQIWRSPLGESNSFLPY